MKIAMIVAYGKKWQIGINNALPWRIKADLQNFKAITTGHHILMGRKTFESIGKPLPNRTTLVLSRSGFTHPGVYGFKDIKSAIRFAETAGEQELFITGGAEIYKTLFPHFEKLYLSEVDYNGDADAYLSPIDFSSWKLIEEQKHKAIHDEKGNIKAPAWTFKVFEKIKNQVYN